MAASTTTAAAAATTTMASTAVKMLRLKGLGLSTEELSRAISPSFVNGFWRKPAISARHLARIRKLTIQNGQEWVQPTKIRYSPIPPPPKRGPKRPKGHKDVRLAPKRAALIEEKMKEMPKLIQKFRQEEHEELRKKREKRAKELEKRKLKFGVVDKPNQKPKNQKLLSEKQLAQIEQKKILWRKQRGLFPLQGAPTNLWTKRLWPPINRNRGIRNDIECLL